MEVRRVRIFAGGVEVTGQAFRQGQAVPKETVILLCDTIDVVEAA